MRVPQGRALTETHPSAHISFGREGQMTAAARAAHSMRYDVLKKTFSSYCK